MSKTTEERRISPRVAVQCPVYYFHFAPSVSRPMTRTLDLSKTGALIEALHPLPLGSTVAFQMITSEHMVADVRAQVVWLDPQQGEKYRVGVRFTHLTGTDRVILERELEHAAA